MSDKTRTAKIKALAQRPGSPGEGAAAKAALLRIKPPTSARRGAHLTDVLVGRHPLPAAGYVIVWDTGGVPGFGCRITAGGARSFVLNYRVKGSGQERRVTIGAAGVWTTGAARKRAIELRRLVDSGGDPRGDQEESREAPTMSDLIDRYEREELPRRRPSTIYNYSGMLKKHIRPFFGVFVRVSEISYADIHKLHRKVTEDVGSPYTANRITALLSKMFSLSIKWGWRTTNPCIGVERNSEQKRRRYLSGDELKRLTVALAEFPDRQFRDIVMLLLLTGARRSEVMAMKWSGLDLKRGTWTKSSNETKQKRDHVTPLSAAALAVLGNIEQRGPWVFPRGDGHVVELKTKWRQLCAHAGIEGLRVHDLRHSYASALINSGATLALVGELLGHSDVATSQRYAHIYDDAARAATNVVGGIIDAAGGKG
jgi:integrase